MCNAFVIPTADYYIYRLLLTNFTANMNSMYKKNILMIKFIARKYNTVLKENARVCIVGAGPAGFYAAMHIKKNTNNVNIDIIERLPVPFGLIRYGVAPDHPEVKNVINQFTKVAKQQNVKFYGNISLGKDLSLSLLRKHYDAVLLTYGADEDKILGIENETAPNVLAARRFVGWYNGLPEDKNLKVDLSGNKVTVLGQGNVALDVARILLTPVDELRKTDITEHALSALAESKIKELYLVGRRGPLQVAFTIKELREQIKMKNCLTVWKKSDFVGVQDVVEKLPRPRKRLTELMLKSLNDSQDISHLSNEGKIFRPIFLRSPSKILVDNSSKLTGVELSCNKLVGDDLVNQQVVTTADKEILECSLVLRSIGYKSVKVDEDINFNEHSGLVVNDKGRVIDHRDDLAKLYVAGWLGTGPVGVILHTMGNAFQVAKFICEDLNSKCDGIKGGFEEIQKVLSQNNVNVIDWSGWEKIDKYEVELGKKVGKPREKVCSVKKMLEIAL